MIDSFLPTEVFSTWYISIKREQILYKFPYKALIFGKTIYWLIREQL